MCKTSGSLTTVRLEGVRAISTVVAVVPRTSILHRMSVSKPASIQILQNRQVGPGKTQKTPESLYKESANKKKKYTTLTCSATITTSFILAANMGTNSFIHTSGEYWN